MTDFPTIVYKSPGKHRGPKGKTFDYRPVSDADAMKAALAAGWSESLDAACSDEPVEAPKRRGRPPKAEQE